MKKSSAAVNAELRTRVFNTLLTSAAGDAFTKINDRQYGIILTDENGTERYVRLGVIVAEEREDMTAQELMQSEIATYEAKRAKQAEAAAKRAEKAKRDAEKRAQAKEKKGD